MIWPTSVKFGEILEKYIINKNMSGNSIILKFVCLKGISVRSLRMVFSQFWKCSVTFERKFIELRKTLTRFLSFWDPDLEKKIKFPKYKNCIELELLNDDLDLQVSI